jgi:hypothetical protein
MTNSFYELRLFGKEKGKISLKIENLLKDDSEEVRIFKLMDAIDAVFDFKKKSDSFKVDL